MKGEATKLASPGPLPLMDILNVPFKMMLPVEASVTQLAIETRGKLRVISVLALRGREKKSHFAR